MHFQMAPECEVTQATEKQSLTCAVAIELLHRAQGNLNAIMTVLVYFIAAMEKILKPGMPEARESRM